MKANNEDKDLERRPFEEWSDPEFNPTTNFSLLGFILDRMRGENDSSRKVDLNLDE